MSIFRDFESSARSHRAPITVALVVAIIISYLLFWTRLMPVPVVQNLVFATDSALSAPWTFVTYPFFTTRDFIGILFLCLWLWSVGGTIEHELGPRRYIAIWLSASVFCALGLWIGALILNRNAFLTSAWSPVAALTVIWGTRYADVPIRFMFVLSLTGKWVAWISAGLLFFSTEPPELAPFAALPLVLAYLYAANKLAFLPYGGSISLRGRGRATSGTRRIYREEYYDDVKRREQQRAEKERLRKLFESSIDEPDEKRD